MSVKPGHWAQGLGQQSASMRPGSLGRANSNRTLNPLSSHNVSSRHGFGVQSHGRAVGEASTSTETQSGAPIASTALLHVHDIYERMRFQL